VYKIVEGDFANQQFPNKDYLVNWPIVYILQNGRQVYIGESNHAKQRMAEHKRTKAKEIFEKVHFIYSAKFNQSVTLFSYIMFSFVRYSNLMPKSDVV
jgi:hypothetical protein